MPITNKGFALSADTALSAMAMFVMLFVITAHTGSAAKESANAINAFGLEKNALLIADALVKNKFENPLLGSAVFNEEKHRVESNELNLERFRKARAIESDEFIVKEIYIKENGLEERKRLSKLDGVNCLAVERLVLVNEKKAIAGVVVCEK